VGTRGARPPALAGAVTALGLALSCGSATAAHRGFAVYVDQDLFVPGVNEDRDYTMGVAVEFFADDGPLYQLDGFVRWFADLSGLPVGGSEAYRSYMLGSVNYTPQDLTQSAPIFDDRPYASLIYLSNKRVVAEGERAVAVDFQLGLLGTDLAGDFQDLVHGWWRDLTDSNEPVAPQGWHNQISDGGELTARVRFAEARLIPALSGPGWLDVAWAWDASLGYQTNASLGVSARLGQLASPFWTIPFDPVNRGTFVPAGGTDELYVWGAARGRVVAYDVLLQGQFRDSVVTVASDDVSRLVWEGSVGVTKSWEKLQLTFAVNAKSAEIDRGGAERSHYWGGLYLNWQF
jgi:hypothetical protein